MIGIEVSTIAIFCLWCKFVSSNTLQFIKWVNVLQSISCLAIPFIMCESPLWLIQNGRNAEAVDVLNYISAFNGKGEESRIEEGTRFVLEEKKIWDYSEPVPMLLKDRPTIKS